MTLINILRSSAEHIRSYNVFISDENDYEDENDETTDQTIIIKKQQYATRLYIPILASKSNKNFILKHW
jgi:hypothetical protein